MQSTRYSCQILMKLEYSRQTFEKNNLISNFMKIRLVGAECPPPSPVGSTDRQTRKDLIPNFMKIRSVGAVSPLPSGIDRQPDKQEKI